MTQENDHDLDESIDKASGALSAPVPPKPKKTAAAPVPPIESAEPPPADAGIGNVAAGLSPSGSSHRRAARQVVVEDAFSHDVAFKFAFLGTGQGGGRIANEFYRLGYRRVGILNSTEMDFSGLHDDIHKHSLDYGGAAKDAQRAAENLQGREEEVWELMQRSWGNDPDYALVCVSLGGGTGSGTAPQLVEIARKYMEDKGHDPKVGAVVSLPTASEGQQVARNALTAFKQLMALKVSPLLIIDNARIHELYQPGMSALHATANRTVTQLFHLFNRLAAIHSDYVTFDRSELAQLLDSGIVVTGAAALDVDEISSPADIGKAIREELTNNVLAEVDLKQGRKGACLFVGSQAVLDDFSLDYFEAGYAQLDRTLASGAIVHRGLYRDTSGDGLQAYTMISELDPPLKRLAELSKKAGLDLKPTKSAMADFLRIDDA